MHIMHQSSVQKTFRMWSVTNAKSFHYEVITCATRNLFNAIRGVTTTPQYKSTVSSVQCVVNKVQKR